MSRAIGTLTGFRRYGGRFVPLTQFGTWNGTATSAQLVDQFGNPVNSAQPTAIYRTDWQGQQLLYPTARTNVCLNSKAFTSASWYTTNLTPADNVATAPDGSLTASTVTVNTVNGQHLIYQTFSSLSAGTYPATLWCKYVSQQYVSFRLDNGTLPYCVIDLTTGTVVAGSGVNVITGPNGWWGFQTTRTVGSPPSYMTLDFMDGASLADFSYTGNGTSQVQVWEGELLSVGTFGIPIPTTSAPVTVTDYTLSGTTVNLAQAPASTATTQWEGRAT